jgi:hypothetical protein
VLLLILPISFFSVDVHVECAAQESTIVVDESGGDVADGEESRSVEAEHEADEQSLE